MGYPPSIATENLSPDMITEYETLDLILEKYMEAAELKCRKLNMGKIPWSPSYTKFIWNLITGECDTDINLVCIEM